MKFEEIKKTRLPEENRQYLKKKKKKKLVNPPTHKSSKTGTKIK
jgi:hypothetical protein